tara:strand:- start:5175 stop:5420 length:246 start_codon:yes stop_codon:yes gene_type:complete
MKVTTVVSLEPQEVEVSVSAEEIAAALAEEPLGVRHALVGINNAAQFVKAITPEMIAEMGPGPRQTIAAFFAEQAERFRPL